MSINFFSLVQIIAHNPIQEINFIYDFFYQVFKWKHLYWTSASLDTGNQTQESKTFLFQMFNDIDYMLKEI